MTTRREFLKQAGAGALLTCSGLPLSALAAKKRKARYLVTTATPYWKLDQDFSGLGPTKKVPLPKGAEQTLNYFNRFKTVFTAIDEDGKNLKRIELASTFHSVFSSPKHGLVYLISTSYPSFLVVLDTENLEVQRFFFEPTNELMRGLTGHGLVMPDGQTLALGKHYAKEIGKFGEISFVDPLTFKESGRFSSYGFDLHEIRLTQDKQFFVCGHYGSYLGHFRYKGLETYGGYDLNTHPHPKLIYPAAATLVSAKDGKRSEILVDVEAGQQGHVVADGQNKVYQATQRALIQNRPGIESNPRILEGERSDPDNGEFAQTQVGAGIAVTYDPKFQEVIVPMRGGNHKIMVTDTRSQKRKDHDVLAPLGWKIPNQDFVHGIEFHPDGKHYVLSTSAGFVVVERGTHKVNKQKSLSVPLLIHTHLHIA